MNLRYARTRFVSPRCLRLSSITPWEQQNAINHLVHASDVPDWLLHASEFWSNSVHVASCRVASTLRRLFRSRQLRYVADTGETWCSPSATLLKGYGDCDDFAILAAGWLLNDRSVEVWVVTGLVWANGGWGGHAWVEGYDECGWFLIEGTNGDRYRNDRPSSYVPSFFLKPGAQFAELAG